MLQLGWSREERELQFYILAGTQPTNTVPVLHREERLPVLRFLTLSFVYMWEEHVLSFYEWRQYQMAQVAYAMNLQLIKKILHESNAGHDKPVCLIIDDTDAPKTGSIQNWLDASGHIFCSVASLVTSTSPCLFPMVPAGWYLNSRFMEKNASHSTTTQAESAKTYRQTYWEIYWLWQEVKNSYDIT